MSGTKITWNELAKKNLAGSILHWHEIGNWYQGNISRVIVEDGSHEENVGIEGTDEVLLHTTADPQTDGAILSGDRVLDFSITNGGTGYIELPCDYDKLPDL